MKSIVCAREFGSLVFKLMICGSVRCAEFYVTITVLESLEVEMGLNILWSAGREFNTILFKGLLLI